MLETTMTQEEIADYVWSEVSNATVEVENTTVKLPFIEGVTFFVDGKYQNNTPWPTHQDANPEQGFEFELDEETEVAVVINGNQLALIPFTIGEEDRAFKIGEYITL